MTIFHMSKSDTEELSNFAKGIQLASGRGSIQSQIESIVYAFNFCHTANFYKARSNLKNIPICTFHNLDFLSVGYEKIKSI